MLKLVMELIACSGGGLRTYTQTSTAGKAASHHAADDILMLATRR